MDLLNEIWTAWNEQWGATIAAILGIIAIAMNAGDRAHRLVSAIARWRVWSIARRWYQSGKRRHRLRRAKRAMFAHIKQTSVWVPVGIHERCLVEDWLTSRRDALHNIIPEKPSWLNDYFVANAMESLHSERKIAKAKPYELSNSWPPTAYRYWFLFPEPGKSIEEQADDFEVEQRCRVEQFPAWRDISSCSESSRFDIAGFSETTAPRERTFGTRVTLKSNAPPCRRCWERKDREENMSLLVDSITKYDLADLTSTEITGDNQEFQTAVTAVLVDSDCPVDAPTVREIVKDAIAIRRNQLNTNSAGNREEWTQQLIKEFKSNLDSQIRAKFK